MSQNRNPSFSVDGPGSTAEGAQPQGTGRIIVNGVEYAFGSLSEEARQLINQMRVAEQELQRHQALVAVIQTARQAWGARLAELVKVSD